MSNRKKLVLIASSFIVCGITIFLPEPSYACLTDPCPVWPTERVFVGIVRKNIGSLYDLSGSSPTFVSTARWNTCPSNTALVARDFQPNGFWMCASSDITGSGAWYLGNVVNNRGFYWEIIPGKGAKNIGSARWDTCRGNALSGRVFNPNGFWLCQPRTL
jgi:hypothetical protein